MGCDMNNACVVIPARYSSTRFPGKPLVNLLGKPMILWVAEIASAAVGCDNVYVATDDERIVDVVKGGGYQALESSDQALTGTDRIAEVATQLEYEVIVNLQGDEPLASVDDILKCVELKMSMPDKVVNGYCSLSTLEDAGSKNIPKVVFNESNALVYMSRAALPGRKEEGQLLTPYKKQVCIYGYDRKSLEAFRSFGRKSFLEATEDIEILRFLELGIPVHMFECQKGSLAVDEPEDVPAVETALKGRRAI